MEFSGTTGDYAAHGLVEQNADEALHQRRAELDIDVEIDQAGAVRPRSDWQITNIGQVTKIGLLDAWGGKLLQR